MQAAQHGRSTEVEVEVEVRKILAVAVTPETRVRLGEALAALGHKVGLTNEDFEVFPRVRDKMEISPLLNTASGQIRTLSGVGEQRIVQGDHPLQSNSTAG